MMMHKAPLNLRGRLLLFTAFTLATGLAAAPFAIAQTADQVVVPGNGTPSDLNAYEIQKVKIQYKKLILREKDIPNAVSEISQQQIEAENPTTGSIQTLLNKTPSVIAYTQQPGQDAPTLAIRGVRNDELSETLDGVPINDLLDGSGDYLDRGTVGSPVTLNEIDGTTIYPGLAPPDHQGFSTAGGTIAYTAKKPTDDRYAEIEGGIGSFDTQHIGFVINTGKIGDGANAPEALMIYDQSQTAGYTDYTPAQFHDFLFNLTKPYGASGLSKAGLLIIYNQGKALVDTLPLPTNLINQYSRSFNFPPSLGFFEQADQFLTVIASDETYINPHLIFDGSLFYLHNSTTSDNYESVAGYNQTTNPLSYTTQVQGVSSFFGPVGASAFNNGISSRYSPGYFTYDPLIFDPGADPTNAASYAAGESDQYSLDHENLIGVDPKLNIFLGDDNTVTIGGLLAKESKGASSYLYGGDAADSVEQNGYNSFTFGGGAQRTIFDGYVQDKISLLNNKLQIVPGVKIDAAYTSVQQVDVNGIYGFVNNVTGATQQAKLQNFTKIGEYYLGAAYNLPHNFILFGSMGKGSLFSPTTSYAVGANAAGLPPSTSAPTPEIVHLFEGGLRYDTPRLYLSADYFYQSIADGFAFFEDYQNNQQYYGNSEGYLFRGVEGEAAFKVTPNLEISANGSYNKTEYTKNAFALDTLSEDQYGYAFTGTPLSNVPDWDGNIDVTYSYGPFSADLGGQYTGREYITTDLQAQPYGSPTVNPNPLNGATVTDTKVENPAYFLVNLLLTYDVPVPHNTALQKVTLALNMQNLTDEKYYEYQYTSENPLNGFYSYLPEYNSGFPGEPRSFTLDLTAKF